MDVDSASTESVDCWTCNAVRIEPVLVPGGGNVYWKPNCSGNSNVLRQGKL